MRKFSQRESSAIEMRPIKGKMQEALCVFGSEASSFSSQIIKCDVSSRSIHKFSHAKARDRSVLSRKIKSENQNILINLSYPSTEV